MSDSINSRKIIERIIIEGDLVLLTPTSLGNGDSDGLTDMSLLLDEVEEKALLTGTSIAGALRNYLQECEKGFEVKENDTSITRQLFGYHEDDFAQSYLIIDDALSNVKPSTELRDGVRIEGKTRTAKNKEKFDFALLEAGTKFKLRFELLICEQKGETPQEIETKTAEFREKLVSALATALQGVEKGEIHIGARKRRGYGKCKVENWTINRFDLETKEGLLAWLGSANHPKQEITDSEIANGLKTALALEEKIKTDDNREYFELNANFAIDGSLLIRSGSKLPKVSDKGQPDTVHLRSNGNPIVSGTSLAGVLRHRAFKIINTLSNEKVAQTITDKIFGDDDSKKQDKSASRLEVRETEIKNTNDLVQTRVKIDRFTGGAFEGALFDAAPVFSDGKEKAVTLSFKLRFKHNQPQAEKDAEIGLLLLLLKDLWTSDLALGGESSIGRGRLKGKTACLNYKNGSSSWHSNMERIDDNKVKIDGIENNSEKIDLLNKFAKSFNENLNPKESSNG